MNYQEALAYLYGLSDYERGGPYTRNPEENLPREARLLELLGNPQDCYTCTLIAGTKGKGSTAAFLERVLRQAGLRTGLYTQPDLHTFRERIQVNGRLITEDEVAELVAEIRLAAEGMRERHEKDLIPTGNELRFEQRQIDNDASASTAAQSVNLQGVRFAQPVGKVVFGPLITYEVATALALFYFCRQHVQHAVLEVGLGGRLDATNVTHPLVSVITSISYDHTQILGDTLTQIATEKAGIIKPNGVVVTSAQAPEALLAIAAVCQRQHARLIRVGAADVILSAAMDLAQSLVEAGALPALSYRYRLEQRNESSQHFTVETPERLYKGLEIPLAGQHQLENATAALATLDMLRQQGIVWDEEALRTGLRNTRWPARIDVVGHNPTIVVDGAHNADSMEKLVQALHDTFTMHRLIVVLSLMRDKDLAGVAKALASVDVVVLTRVQNPRAATIEQMQEAFAEHAPHVKLYAADNSNLALDKAVILSEAKDLICATGSLYLAGEALRWAAARGDATAAATIEGDDHRGAGPRLSP